MDNLKIRLQKLDAKGAGAYLATEANKEEVEDDVELGVTCSANLNKGNIKKADILKRGFSGKERYEISLEEEKEHYELNDSDEPTPEYVFKDTKECEREGKAAYELATGNTKTEARKIIADVCSSTKTATYTYDLTVPVKNRMGAFLNWIYQTSNKRYKMLATSDTEVIISYDNSIPFDQEEYTRKYEQEDSEASEESGDECSSGGERNDVERNLNNILSLFRRGLSFHKKGNTKSKKLVISTATKGFSESDILTLVLENPDIEPMDIIKIVTKRTKTWKLINNLYNLSSPTVS